MIATTPVEQHTGLLSIVLKTRGTRDSFRYQTDFGSLVSLLGIRSGLPSYTVDSFFNRLKIQRTAYLNGVHFDDETLQKLGFFID